METCQPSAANCVCHLAELGDTLSYQVDFLDFKPTYKLADLGFVPLGKVVSIKLTKVECHSLDSAPNLLPQFHCIVEL